MHVGLLKNLGLWKGLYRVMHYSAKCGRGIARRLSVCL